MTKLDRCLVFAVPLLLLGCSGSGLRPRTAYHALGNDPGWLLSISSSRIEFVGGEDRARILVPTPLAQPLHGGRRYEAPRLSVTITTTPCNDDKSGVAFSDTVQVIADNRTYSGCGGTRLPLLDV